MEIKAGRIFFLLCLSGIIFLFLQAVENGLLTPAGPPEDSLFAFPRLAEILNAGTDIDWAVYSFFQDPAGLSSLVLNLDNGMKEKPVTKDEGKTFSLGGFDLKDFYRKEIDYYEKLNIAALERWEKHLELEIEDKLRCKERQLQYMVQKAVAEKEQLCAKELADFERKTEDQCRARLADLRFRICLSGTTAEEREFLEKEILTEEKQMMEKINMKANELQEELAAFIEEQKAVVQEELANYRQQLLQEKEIRRREEIERLFRDRQRSVTYLGEGGLEHGHPR